MASLDAQNFGTKRADKGQIAAIKRLKLPFQALALRRALTIRLRR